MFCILNVERNIIARTEKFEFVLLNVAIVLEQLQVVLAVDTVMRDEDKEVTLHPDAMQNLIFALVFSGL